MKHRWPAVLWMGLFCLGYLLTFVHGVPGIKYYPVEHAWGPAGAHDGPSMAWFGKIAVGIAFGAVGWLVGAIIGKAKGPEAKPPAAVEAGAWVLVLVALIYTAQHEWVKWL